MPREEKIAQLRISIKYMHKVNGKQKHKNGANLIGYCGNEIKIIIRHHIVDQNDHYQIITSIWRKRNMKIWEWML